MKRVLLPAALFFAFAFSARASVVDDRLGDALARFSADSAPARVILYSRGDDGPCTGRDFIALFQAVGASLDAATGVSGVRRPVPPTARLLDLRVWEWAPPGALYRLEIGSTGQGSKLQGEFIRLGFFPAASSSSSGPAAAPPVHSTRRDILKKADLLSNVVRNGTAVTIDNIPMVDQGDKGYCAAATLSRLLSYYGLATVDQHELAAAMGTSAEGGTSSLAMKDGMATCGHKFGLRLADIDELDYRDYERLVKEYNSAARKHGVPRIENRGVMPVVGEPFWALADGPTLRDARDASSPQKQRQWLKEVRKYLDQGIPVVWGVYCGLFPEQGRMVSGRGGHLRLLVGYDEAQALVYYSDTWGPGHECKPMPLADAIAITRSLFVLSPKW